MKTLLFYAVISFSSFLSYSQPNIHWLRKAGTTGTESGVQSFIRPNGTVDLFGYAAGSTTIPGGMPVYGNYDCFRVNVAQDGAYSNGLAIGGTGNDYPTSVIKTPAGAYLGCGSSFSSDYDGINYHGNTDAFVFLTDPTGPVTSSRCFGGSDHDYGVYAIMEPDGTVTMTGYTSSTDGDLTGNKGNADAWLLNYTPGTGMVNFSKNYGGTNGDYGTCILPAPGGGWFLSVTSSSADNDIHTANHGNADAVIMKINADQSVAWSKTYGGSDVEKFSRLFLTADNKIMVFGHTKSNDQDVSGNHQAGSYDTWMVKMELDGTVIWQKCFGGTGEDYVMDARMLANGNFILAAGTTSNDGDVSGNHGLNDGWLLCISPSGTLIWQKCIGGSAEDYLSGVDITPLGDIVIAGSTNSTNGDMNVPDMTNGDAYVAHLGAGMFPASVAAMETKEPVHLFPNPAVEHVFVSLQESPDPLPVRIDILDITGRILSSYSYKQAGDVQLDVSGLQPGAYFASIVCNETVYHKSFVKQ